jgi:NAD(P)-dependent dehydrogenase (short-subunit alcohol dehydrogenase family)
MKPAIHALVTGANRGLGLALSAVLLEKYGASVVLATRSTQGRTDCEQLLHEYGEKGTVVPLDYDDTSSIHAAAELCRARMTHLDLLINCAGANFAEARARSESKGGIEELGDLALQEMFRTNVIGPMITCQAFYPLLRKARQPCVVNVSTSRASLTMCSSGGSFGYAVTKAALNMATRKLAFDMAAIRGGAVAVDPGWIRTRMGGHDAPDDPREVAEETLHTVLGRIRELNGKFITAAGEVIPW